MKVNFYRCPICGNIIVKMFDGGVVPVCCGKPMMLLEANTTDGKTEYHVPVIEKVDDRRLRVKIGKEPHPMKKEHYIQFIFVETCSKQGKHAGHFVWLQSEDAPQCTFCLCTEDVVNVYEYCNVHGLWKLAVSDSEESKREADYRAKDDAEKCGVYPAFCGECPKDPREAYYSCD